MCFFHYSLCDHCRFPSTACVTLVYECDDFLQHVKDEHTAPDSTTTSKKDGLTRLREEGLLGGGSALVERGSYTTAKQVIEHRGHSFDLMWDVQPPSDCVRWAPKPVMWVCQRCRQSGEDTMESYEDPFSDPIEPEDQSTGEEGASARATQAVSSPDSAVPDFLLSTNKAGDAGQDTTWKPYNGSAAASFLNPVDGSDSEEHGKAAKAWRRFSRKVMDRF